MSSYGEKRDRDDERLSGDLAAMQRGIQNSDTGRSGSSSKKKNTRLCISFLVILIIAVAIVIIISL